jgi:DNA-binding CsgD family transcriptional regulator
MSLRLSQQDLTDFHAAQSALLTPLEHASSDQWRSTASERVARLLKADQVMFALPRTTPGSTPVYGRAYDITSAISSYASHFARLDLGMNVTRRERGLQVYHRDHLYDRQTLGSTEIYVDWAVPNRLLDILGMGFDPLAGELFAALHVCHDHEHGPDDPESSGAFGQRGLALFRLLLPAFKAGVRTHLEFLARPESLFRVFDQLDPGLAIYNPRGMPQFRNRSLQRMLAAEPERYRLESMIGLLASRCALPPGGRLEAPSCSTATVITPVNTYRLSATRSAAAVGARMPWILVLVQPQRPQRLSDEVLEARYRLTRRQIEVAELLAQGNSDSSIATRLGVSLHTARRHTEAVLQKLDVHTRGAVGPLLLT